MPFLLEVEINMNKKEFKFIFAPIGVGIGISLFICMGLFISNKLGILKLTQMLWFIPKFVLFILGIIMIAVFLPIFIFGTICLNRRGAVGQSNSLRTNGIYKYIRNPMYVGISFIIMGVGILLNSLGLLLGGVLWLLITIIQCEREEKELLLRFGNEYQTYKKKTPMFFPDIPLILKNIIQKIKQ
ncbi:MAG: isoprenylcysteine carboxylmethyltransferase family protein [Candidatus Stahlbacteria bacterium]|nr:isoprenylcysteine carboxylmethyltransferase family protein [Candidatus Stahlbacteria bacterium]